MAREIFLASTNSGKISEMTTFFNYYDIDVVVPNKKLEVEETESTLGGNALKKVRAYQELAEGRPVVADDTGFEIDYLDGEPGIYVRRWQDHIHEMSDREIIDHCLFLMKGVPMVKRGATLKSVVALALPNNGGYATFTGSLKGHVLEAPQGVPVEGFPLESIVLTQYGLLLKELRDTPLDQREGRFNHREKALHKVRAALK